jgi:TRAP-type C4-dicarboxylate transport system permease small subunit
MNDKPTEAARPADQVGRALFTLAKALAIVGGILCCIMAVVVTVSVTGRYLFSAPIPGDYDVVGIIAGGAVFCFLPYCQMTRGNVLVDFFTEGLGSRSKAALDAFGALLYLAIAILFTWRLYYGMLELRDSNQVLASFNFFRWWTVPFNLACMGVLIAVIAYTLIQNIDTIRTGEQAGTQPTGD